MRDYMMRFQAWAIKILTIGRKSMLITTHQLTASKRVTSCCSLLRIFATRMALRWMISRNSSHLNGWRATWWDQVSCLPTWRREPRRVPTFWRSNSKSQRVFRSRISSKPARMVTSDYMYTWLSHSQPPSESTRLSECASSMVLQTPYLSHRKGLSELGRLLLKGWMTDTSTMREWLSLSKLIKDSLINHN